MQPQPGAGKNWFRLIVAAINLKRVLCNSLYLFGPRVFPNPQKQVSSCNLGKTGGSKQISDSLEVRAWPICRTKNGKSFASQPCIPVAFLVISDLGEVNAKAAPTHTQEFIWITLLLKQPRNVTCQFCFLFPFLLILKFFSSQAFHLQNSFILPFFFCILKLLILQYFSLFVENRLEKTKRCILNRKRALKITCQLILLLLVAATFPSWQQPGTQGWMAL